MLLPDAYLVDGEEWLEWLKAAALKAVVHLSVDRRFESYLLRIHFALQNVLAGELTL